MEYLRIMFHYGIHAQPVAIITHETNTIPGLPITLLW